MIKYNVNDMKIALKAQQTKPKDWDNNNEIISHSEIKLVIFLPYNEMEQKLYPVLTEGGKIKDDDIIVETPKKQEEWFMKYNNEISGPFSSNELIFRATDLDITEVQCKRNTDNIFINLELVKEIINEEEKLNKEFKKLTIKINGDLFRPQKAQKSMKFLAEKKSLIQIVEIFRRINGKDTKKALKILNDYTGMKRDDNLKFLNLFISEIGNSFLSDKKN